MPGATCRLPEDLNSWNRIPGFQNLSARFYNRTELDAAILNVGDLYHYKALFRKLNSGRRLLVTALGSSFIHDTAGCYQRNNTALWSLGVVPNPMLYPPVSTQPGVALSSDKCTIA